MIRWMRMNLRTWMSTIAVTLGVTACANNPNWGPKSAATVTKSESVANPSEECRVEAIQALRVPEGWMAQLQFVCDEELPLRVINWVDDGSGVGVREVAGGPGATERVELTISSWEIPQHGAHITGRARALKPWSYGDAIEVEFALTLSLGDDEQCLLDGYTGIAQSVPTEDPQGVQPGHFCCPTGHPCIE